MNNNGWKSRLKEYNLKYNINSTPITMQSGGNITTYNSQTNVNIRENYFDTITLDGTSYSTHTRPGIELIKNIIAIYDKLDSSDTSR